MTAILSYCFVQSFREDGLNPIVTPTIMFNVLTPILNSCDLTRGQPTNFRFEDQRLINPAIGSY
jgi:hypothetical protein